jgi:4-aminobutyrate aminotransferase
MGEVLPPGLDRMFFANSGSEATEAALRLSRQATGRPNIIGFTVASMAGPWPRAR